MMRHVRTVIALSLILTLCCSGCLSVTGDWPDNSLPGSPTDNEDTTAPPVATTGEPGAHADIPADRLGYYRLAVAMEEAYGAGDPVVAYDYDAGFDDETALSYISMIIPRYIVLSIEMQTLNDVVTSVAYTSTFPLPIDSRFAEAEAILKSVVDNNITPGMTEREKLQVIHDWVVEQNVYPDDYDDDARSAAALVLNGNAICSGYADAVKIMCDYAGIPCVNVHGAAVNSEGLRGSHGWNAVYVGGEWLHLDATFDDPQTSDGANVLRHNYFLVTTDEIMQNHFCDVTLSWEVQLNFAEWYYSSR